MTDRLYIAIDGGGTGTRVGLYDDAGKLIAETKGLMSNPYQLSPHEAADRLVDLSMGLLRDWPSTSVVIAAGVSGARVYSVLETLAHTLCGRIRQTERAVVTTDVHAHLLGNSGGHASALVIAGTGSSVAVIDANADTSLFGGRGPIIGDNGSGYELAVKALRTTFALMDKEESSRPLLRGLIAAADVKGKEALIHWCCTAAKHEIAALAECVLEQADKGDEVANQCVTKCATSLATVLQTAIHRTELGLKAPVYLMGGLFEKSFLYCDQFRRALRQLDVTNELKRAPLIGHAAVYQFAQLRYLSNSVPHCEARPMTLAKSASIDLVKSHDDDSAPLDTLNTVMLIERMQRADAFAAAAVKSCSEPLALLINRVVKAFRHGGRLVYIGAGTSGRLGVLDASECPPTFGVPLTQVIGIMAGGDRALRDSVEGAEDDPDLGRADIEKIDPPIGKDDVVVGIAASGTTPYTLGAIATAKALGASTAMVCCNPNTTAEVDYLLVLPTGAEVLPGSTRLKAGTATKMVLNTITTGAMALSGRVFEGYMIGVQPTNSKLRKRAAHIISVLTGINEEDAARRLQEAGNDVAVEVMMERLKIPADNARELLNKTRGDVRAAIALHKNSG